MIGRILREKMLDDAAETPERIAERKRWLAAVVQARDEALAKFPAPGTPLELREALDWQRARERELSGR